MKTGSDIKSLHDIRMMITYLCISEKGYTKEEIFSLAQQHMENSRIIVNKLLKTIINQVIDYFLKQGLLIRYNGRFYQLSQISDINKNTKDEEEIATD